MYISSFGVNHQVGPVFSVFRWLGSFALSLPFESQYFKWYLAGPINVNNVSNCSGKSPVKNFVFCLFFRTTLGSNMLTRFEMHSSLSWTTVWFLKIIVSTLAPRTYCSYCLCVPLSQTDLKLLCFSAGSGEFCILKDFRSEQWGTNKHTCVYQEHIWQLFISPSYIILHHVTNTTQNTTVNLLNWFHTHS